MADAGFQLTFPCYFLYGNEGGLVTNPVSGQQCLCLFTSTEAVQRFKQWTNLFMHGPEHVDLEVATHEVEGREGLLERLTNADADLAASGIRHTSIDPVPGQPTPYGTIREFIEMI
jgi:hypothetical protein